jgi:hypothetical protein
MAANFNLVPICSSAVFFYLCSVKKIGDLFPNEYKNFSHDHRVYRVPGFLSSRPNWLPPPIHPQASIAFSPPPPLVPGGGTHSLAGEGTGGGEPIRRKRQTLWYIVFSL